MPTAKEKLKIIQMLKDKEISTVEAAELLKAMDSSDSGKSGEQPHTKEIKRGKWMRVRVTDIGTGKIKVNLKLPIGILKTGLKLGAQFSPKLREMDPAKLLEAIQEGGPGKIVDVNEPDDNEHVEIIID
jgi:hypothetical protein